MGPDTVGGDDVVCSRGAEAGPLRSSHAKRTTSSSFLYCNIVHLLEKYMHRPTIIVSFCLQYVRW